MLRDFDLDGKLDIATILFFTDYSNYPKESSIYLENKVMVPKIVGFQIVHVYFFIQSILKDTCLIVLFSLTL